MPNSSGTNVKSIKHHQNIIKLLYKLIYYVEYIEAMVLFIRFQEAQPKREPLIITFHMRNWKCSLLQLQIYLPEQAVFSKILFACSANKGDS